MRAAAVIVAAVAAACLLGWLTGFLVRRAARGRYNEFLTKLNRECHRPFTAFLLVAALLAVLPLTGLSDHALRGTRHLLLLGLIATAAWLAVKALFVAEDAAFRRLPIDVVDNRRMRRARTQIGLMRRLTAVAITLLALAAAMMTFPQLRTLGASLFASAGIAGIIVGLAAQSTLGNVLAGLQLAFTDTLRLDDVIVVETEWGRVEDLSLTHVVVRLWDERRLILPTTYFTTKPFENWTRHEARVLGTVLLHLDHSTPVEQLRAEAMRLAEKSPLWDRRVCAVQVVDTTPQTIVVRVLVSAADGAGAFDLRCELREALIEFLRERHPESLPVMRARILNGGEHDDRVPPG